MWGFKGGEDAELGVLHHGCRVFSKVVKLRMWIGRQVLGVVDELLNRLIGSVGGGVVSVDGLEFKAERRLDDRPQTDDIAPDQLHPFRWVGGGIEVGISLQLIQGAILALARKNGSFSIIKAGFWVGRECFFQFQQFLENEGGFFHLGGCGVYFHEVGCMGEVQVIFMLISTKAPI